MMIPIETGREISRDAFLIRLVENLYERNDIDFKQGCFRVRGETVDIFPAYMESAIRVEFWGDEVDQLSIINPTSGESVQQLDEVTAEFRASTNRKTLRISVQPFFASELLMPALTEFQDAHPDVDLALDAVPDKVIPGRVQSIVPVKDPGARTFLLRVLAEGEFYRVGGMTPIRAELAPVVRLRAPAAPAARARRTSPMPRVVRMAISELAISRPLTILSTRLRARIVGPIARQASDPAPSAMLRTTTPMASLPIERSSFM